MSSVNEMNNNGIEVKKACYYSGINRITYYYRIKHENIEDNRRITRIDNNIIDKLKMKKMVDIYSEFLPPQVLIIIFCTVILLYQFYPVLLEFI